MSLISQIIQYFWFGAQEKGIEKIFLKKEFRYKLSTMKFQNKSYLRLILLMVLHTLVSEQSILVYSMSYLELC